MKITVAALALLLTLTSFAEIIKPKPGLPSGNFVIIPPPGFPSDLDGYVYLIPKHAPSIRHQVWIKKGVTVTPGTYVVSPFGGIYSKDSYPYKGYEREIQIPSHAQVKFDVSAIYSTAPVPTFTHIFGAYRNYNGKLDPTTWAWRTAGSDYEGWDPAKPFVFLMPGKDAVANMRFYFGLEKHWGANRFIHTPAEPRALVNVDDQLLHFQVDTEPEINGCPSTASDMEFCGGGRCVALTKLPRNFSAPMRGEGNEPKDAAVSFNLGGGASHLEIGDKYPAGKTLQYSLKRLCVEHLETPGGKRLVGRFTIIRNGKKKSGGILTQTSVLLFPGQYKIAVTAEDKETGEKFFAEHDVTL